MVFNVDTLYNLWRESVAKALGIQIDVSETSKALEDSMLTVVLGHYKHALQGIDSIISAELRRLIKEAIEQSNVYDALVNKNEELYFELGAIKSPEAILSLIEILQESVQVSRPIIMKSQNSIRITLQCAAVNTNWSKSTNLSTGKYTSHGKDGETTEIPWLKWLLTSPPFIAGYQVQFGSGMPGSRTGGALMKKTGGGGWEFPVEYRGNARDNFVTRAISQYGVEEKLQKFVLQTIQRLAG